MKVYNGLAKSTHR